MSAAVASRTAGLALVMIAGLSGCGLPEEIAEAAKTPRDVLAASAPGLESPPFAYTILGVDPEGVPQDLKGVVSPAAQSYDLATSYTDRDAGFTMNLRFRVVGPASWVRVTFDAEKDVQGLPELPDKWLKVDPARAGDEDDALPTAFTPADADPGTTAALISTAVAVTETGTGAYAGTMDLTRASDWELVDVAAAGDAVKSVPFTASVDGTGRLTALTVEIPAIGEVQAFSYQVTYAYGTAAPVEAPAAPDTAETPDLLYDLFAA
ncbi:hypothetical protein [Catenuloplanes atrovinosus]|uniref:Lipoprotein n=1 Tax=Catenuloplanes atrovinosus TaxID=137266 RepID=A0AAE4CDA6_9ACTN|nr:hypothetical protein [Catenuloplanes atrovinosus]MDR7278849.1 hypothetical protein [Catenuloplanes atrovinosus]